jgi:hypothetical protein
MAILSSSLQQNQQRYRRNNGSLRPTLLRELDIQPFGLLPIRTTSLRIVRAFSRVAKKVNVSADEAMLSAMSSLQLQLAARVSIGNCCSNFHRMLQDYLSEGCGAASDSYFHCLQEDDDPEHRVCCFKSKSCIETRQRQMMEQNSSLLQHFND